MPIVRHFPILQEVEESLAGHYVVDDIGEYVIRLSDNKQRFTLSTPTGNEFEGIQQGDEVITKRGFYFTINRDGDGQIKSLNLVAGRLRDVVLEKQQP